VAEIPIMVRARFLAITMAVMAAGAACSPDRTTAPDSSRPTGVGPAADIGNIATDPTLFSQTSTGSSILRVDLPGLTTLLADDFVVPAGQIWTLKSVIVAGDLIKPTLPFSIRADAGGRPGAVIGNWTVAPTATDPDLCCNVVDYLLTLPSSLTLSAGTYWLTVESPAFGWQIGAGSGAGPMLSTDTGGSWFATGDAGNAFSLFGTVQSTQSTQTITFTSTAPAPAYVNGTYTVSATGGASGNPVVITVGSPNVCSLSGNVVRFVGVGTCVIAANQAGNATFDAAPQVTQTVKVDYRFSGFADPVNNNVVNSVKAGKAIPLKWRVTDAAGAPITTLTAATITVKDLSCTIGSTANQLEESTAGGSGLQNLGNGYYQLNWKTSSAYARSCKTLQLDLGEGSGVRSASFEFTK
jgi:hypothetical protein